MCVKICVSASMWHFLCLFFFVFFSSLVVLSYSDLGVFVLSYFTFIPQMTACFLRRDIKIINSEEMGGEEKLKEIRGQGTIARKYCMKKSCFRKKEDKGKMGFLRQEETKLEEG